MIVLDTVSDSVVAQIEGAHTTAAPRFVCAGADYTTSTFAPLSSKGLLNGSSEVTVVAAPAGGVFRLLRSLLFYNADSVAHTFSVKVANGADRYPLVVATVAAGGFLSYEDGLGWAVSAIAGLDNAVIMPVSFFAAGVATALTCTTNKSWAVYLGRAVKAYSSIGLRYNVTTAAVTVTWAEVGIGKATPSPGATQQISRVGYTDVSAVVTGTGVKQTNVACSDIAPGDDLWALFGNQASTPMAIRAGIADNMASGIFCGAASTRISTMAVPANFAVDGSSAMPWIQSWPV